MPLLLVKLYCFILVSFKFINLNELCLEDYLIRFIGFAGASFMWKRYRASVGPQGITQIHHPCQFYHLYLSLCYCRRSVLHHWQRELPYSTIVGLPWGACWIPCGLETDLTKPRAARVFLLENQSQM